MREWQEQVTFGWDNDDARFVLDQHAPLDTYCANSRKQQPNARHVTTLGYIILIPDCVLSS